MTKFENSVLSRREQLQRRMEVATGRQRADLVLKNATYVNVFSNELLVADIAVCDGVVAGIGSYEGLQEIDMTGKIVCPGLIDSHIHLESSLVSPVEFARAVLPHGTTAVVTDPHEIANVMGVDGIRFLLQATRGLPLKVHFMLPSCVPATDFDEAGATLTQADLEPLYDDPRVIGLAEMMNAFGVTHNAPDVLDKIAAAQLHGKPIDGHAPGLSGNDLNAYAAAGIDSDHECATAAEGLEKLRRGQYIMIREGTAARNLQALAPLLQSQYAARCLFCTDDKHPSDLLEKGHMDAIVRAAIGYGADPIWAVRAASLHAAQRFGLTGRGAIAPGYCADFTVVDDLHSFQVEQVFCDGTAIYTNGVLCPLAAPAVEKNLQDRALHTFQVAPLQPEQFRTQGDLAVMGMVPGQIITVDAGRADRVDTAKDILKIAVIERHHGTGHIGLGYIQGYGLKHGAVATSISHDSHNIIVVGANDADMAAAANRIVQQGGGITVVKDGEAVGNVVLELAGLMSQSDLVTVNRNLEDAKAAAHTLGVSAGIDPFMTLSFMSLPVIPSVRLCTRGMMDVATQQYI